MSFGSCDGDQTKPCRPENTNRRVFDKNPIIYSIFVEELAKLFLKFLTDEPVPATLVKCNSRIHGAMDADDDPRGHRTIHAFEIFFHETVQTARRR